jgi:myo-inositol-1(or 4)-monophosphatase
MRSVAAEAAAYIRKERGSFSQGAVESKGLNDLVSHVDRNSEKLIVERLRVLNPDAGFIVEENTVTGRRSANWIVDPLDGTTNFVHGIPSYAVSIALEREGEIVAGVVHEVSRNECFHAFANGGAFLNDRPIRVSETAKLVDSLIATGFPVKNFERLDPFVRATSHFMRNTRGVRRLGAASVDLCYLACGRFDGFFEYNLSPWDVAAGAIIIREAGGNVYDFSGRQRWLHGREIACTNGKIDGEFLSVIRESFGG